MKKIYGNRPLLSTIENMTKNNHTVNSVIFFGEKGSGKKLIADYYANTLLCENPEDDKPCGICNSCRNFLAGNHPDVKYPETSGKLEGYSVDTVRNIISDAFIKPNNKTGRKIYIFRDCRNMDTRPQNMLLKIIEEPPEYAFFIFTAESKYEFLPTIISRCICFPTSPCSEEDTICALKENGFSENEITSAVECFHGNIGMCIDYIKNDRLGKYVDLTKRISDSIIRKDEYSLGHALCSAGSDRKNIFSVLSMFDKLMRDCAVLNKDKNAQTIGCCRESAERLSERITPCQAEKIHISIENAASAVRYNVSAPVALSALCAEISDII
ncbi:MAG: DNA polymerase III subunit delta' [Ruminococcus sp.]|nr:DNA polymerase III subunit delta' [Ruminococcus sp.]